jgi:outer membrane protein assembly factor BamB
MGPSYSGPIVVGDRILVTETEEKKSEVVRALDRATGKELWRRTWVGSMSVPFFARSNGSWIRSTPAYDDGMLYVAGMRDVLVCLRASDGEVVWRVDFVERFGTPLPAFGFVSSPLIDGDALYVQAGASLVKLDKRTGETIWRSLNDAGGMWGSAFSSPYLCDLNGRRILLVQTRTNLAAVAPEDGKVIWSQEIPAFRGMNILTPTLINNKVFTSSYGGRSFLYAASPSADGWTVDEIWNNKAQGYMSSPVVIDDHIYLHLRNQRFTCIDAKSGETKWTTKPYGKYWSLVANGNQILALDERGELLLIEANPSEFSLIGRVKVSEEATWAHLAVVGDQLFIRELNAISAFRWTKIAKLMAQTSK